MLTYENIFYITFGVRSELSATVEVSVMRAQSLVTVCAVGVTILLTGCNPLGPSSELLATGQALVDTSERCVFDVRDKRLKYKQAPSCLALSALADQFIKAGGGKLGVSPQVELMFSNARLHAWMALALSESTEPALLSIW